MKNKLPLEANSISEDEIPQLLSNQKFITTLMRVRYCTKKQMNLIHIL